MNEETPARLDGLTSLRFFLASAVVIGHHAGRDISQYGSVATLINAMAPYAVSWFFVLSGFVLFYNYRALPTGRDRLNFIALRFARVWPVHIVTLVATLGIFYYAAHIAKTQPGYVGLTAAMLHTWLPDANLNGAFNGPSWSISDEWFFYLCFVGFVAPLRWV